MTNLNRRAMLSPIGLEVAPSEFRAVQLSRNSGGETSLVAAALIPRMVPGAGEVRLSEGESSWLAAALARRGFVGTKIAVAAPVDSCSVHVVDLPNRDSGAPTEMIARAEVARSAGLGPNDFELASWYLPARGRSEQGMAVACARSGLDAMLDDLDAGGLDTIAVDIREAALVRSCGDSLNENQINVVLRLGWRGSLGVLTLGDEVVYTRQFETGIGHWVSSMSEKIGMPAHTVMRLIDRDIEEGSPELASAKVADQAWASIVPRLARELDTAITYVSHAYRAADIGGVFLTGYGSER